MHRRGSSFLASPYPWDCLRFSLSQKLPHETTSYSSIDNILNNKGLMTVGSAPVGLGCPQKKLSSLLPSTTTSTLHDKDISGHWRVAHCKAIATALEFNFMPGFPRCALFLSITSAPGAEPNHSNILHSVPAHPPLGLPSFLLRPWSTESCPQYLNEPLCLTTHSRPRRSM